MSDPETGAASASRRRDLLLTAVLLGIALTPAWLLPPTPGLAWAVVVAALGAPALVHSWRHAPWQPTPAAERDRLLAHLALRADQTFCDLGAGDGRLVLWVHRATGATCTGLEVAPLAWLVAQGRLAWGGSDRTSVRLADLYRTDLSRFDVLYVWGTAYSVTTPRFGAHVRRTARPGARLVSYHHPVHGLEPTAVDRTGQRPIWVYDLPGPG